MAPVGAQRAVSVASVAACFLFLLLLAHPAASQTQGGSTVSSGAPAPVRDSRLFLGPTARALPQGEGYFILYGGFLPAFQVGLTDRVSLGAGTFYLNKGNFWVTPKVQFLRRDRMSMSATLLQFFVPGEGGLGFAFVSTTRDTARGGLTFGVGAAYSSGWSEDDDWAIGGPLFVVGADHQLTRRVAFVSENYIVAGAGGMLFNGVRSAWGRFSLDAAALVFVSDSVVGGPFLNLAWRF